ncbi:uncharacterized protein METZ01_LOCUS220952, partial [marine metagenome]
VKTGIRVPENQPLDSGRILILDYGSQYTQLIARRVREAGVYSEIHPCDLDIDALRAFRPSGIILSGGPDSVEDGTAPGVSDAVLELQVPLLGICYGMQALAQKLGGVVQSSSEREFGYAEVEVSQDDELLGGLARSGEALKVWMSHGDRVESLPNGFKSIAVSGNSLFAAMA